MGVVRTHQFACTSLVATGPQTLYTVPDGHRALVKHVTMMSFAPAPGHGYAYIGDADLDPVTFLISEPLTSFILLSKPGLYGVAEAGQIIGAQITSVTGGSTSVLIAGVLFEV